MHGWLLELNAICIQRKLLSRHLTVPGVMYTCPRKHTCHAMHPPNTTKVVLWMLLNHTCSLRNTRECTRRQQETAEQGKPETVDDCEKTHNSFNNKDKQARQKIVITGWIKLNLYIQLDHYSYRTQWHYWRSTWTCYYSALMCNPNWWPSWAATNIWWSTAVSFTEHTCILTAYKYVTMDTLGGTAFTSHFVMSCPLNGSNVSYTRNEWICHHCELNGQIKCLRTEAQRWCYV